MKAVSSTIARIPAKMPLFTLSAPSDGAVSKTALTLIWKGKLPLVSASAMFCASSLEKRPEISALPPVMLPWITGAQ